MSTGEPVVSLRVIILGTDALLEARPATPIQLARACLAAGFDFVAPVSWGEELLATQIIESVKDMAPPSSLIVHCPFVAEALREQNEVLPMMWRAAAPPVVAARYVRAAFAPRALHVTYAGRCPGASAPDLDACLLPQVLFGHLLEKGIDPEEQPKYFEEMLPPDRSRYASLPGGVPEPALLHDLAGARLREAAAATLRAVALAFESSEPVVIDLEAASGCVCARDRFAASQLEPPRSPAPVVASGLEVDLAHYRAPREVVVPREHAAAADAPAPAPQATQNETAALRRPEPPSFSPRRPPPAVSTGPTTPRRDAPKSPAQESTEQWPPADLVATLEPWLRKLTPPRPIESPAPAAEASASAAPPSDVSSSPSPAPSDEATARESEASAEISAPEPPAVTHPESDAATQVGDAYPPAGEAIEQIERGEHRTRWDEHLRRGALIALIAAGIVGGSAYAAYRAGWTGTRRPDSSQEQVPQLPAQEVTSPSSGDVPAAADSLRGDSLIPVASPRRDTTPSASDTLMARSIARGSASTIR